MSIKPYNYCTKAIDDLGALVHLGEDGQLLTSSPSKALDKEILATAKEVSILLQNAVKFISPDWGRIFTDQEALDMLKWGVLAKLPYDLLAIEFPCQRDESMPPLSAMEEASSKRIAIAVETQRLEELCPDYLWPMVQESAADGFFVLPVSYADRGKLWIVPPAISFFDADESMKAYDPVLLPFCEAVYDNYAAEDTKVRIERDLNQENIAVAHLIMALNTKNIRQETISAPPRLNHSRLRKGKTPLYDYKVLDIVAEIVRRGGRVDDQPHGSHSSPRMHLRRGHVRRLPTGRMTWVRHTVVGKEQKGIVEKEYAVHK